MAASGAATTRASGWWTPAHFERLLRAADLSEANDSSGSQPPARFAPLNDRSRS